MKSFITRWYAVRFLPEESDKMEAIDHAALLVPEEIVGLGIVARRWGVWVRYDDGLDAEFFRTRAEAVSFIAAIRLATPENADLSVPRVPNHYLLTARDDEFWLVGPFLTQERAAEWGRDPANNPDDDPRWQTITLTKVPEGVEVRSPGTSAPAIATVHWKTVG